MKRRKFERVGEFNKKFNNLFSKKHFKGNQLKREEAIAILKEIAEACNTVSIEHISLKPVTESEGYELHIKDHFEEKDCERLQDILQNHNLNMKKHNGYLVINTLKPL